MITYAQALLEGKTIKFRPQGDSMTPMICSGQLVTVSPIIVESGEYALKVGDIVLCKVNGRFMLHKITAVGSDGRYQISNNHGHVNGWCTRKNVFGIVTQVEP